MISNIKGDLLYNVKNVKGNVIIPHVCNNIGAWGAGFVVPLGKKYPLAKEEYKRWFNEDQYNFFLGNTQFVQVDNNVFVANMVAQDGITSGSTGDRSRVVDRPLRYDALFQCMIQVADFAESIDPQAVIHCPKFGSGLAGGYWGFIIQMIEDIWDKRGLDTVVYTYGI